MSIKENGQVKAAFAPQTQKSDIIYSDANFGSVTVTNMGAITITYLYGYSELMILATRCKDYNSDNSACDQFEAKYDVVLHVSGDYNATHGKGAASKQFHLLDYFDYEEIIEVKIITSFMHSAFVGSYSGEYNLLYCNVEAYPGAECSLSFGQTINMKSSVARTQNFICNGDTRWEYDANWAQSQGGKKGNYYTDRGRVNTSCSSYLSDMSLKFSGKKYTVFGSSLNNSTAGKVVYIKVDNSKVSDSSGDVTDLIYDTIIPALIAILIVIAGISCAVLGYKIVKSADEPQERQDSVKRLRNILIGIAIALVLLFGAEPFTNFIKRFIE